jgi:DNA-binding NarL/FixJ family response regulator
MKIKTLLVDDSPETLQVLQIQYGLFPEIQIVGQASSFAEALAAMASSQAELVSIDIQLGYDNGLDLCSRIHSEYPRTFVVVCSVEADDKMRKMASAAGADFFLAKPVSSHDLQILFQTYRERTSPSKQEENHEPLDWANDILDSLK